MPVTQTMPYDTLAQQLAAAGTAAELYQLIVDAPFAHQVETALLFLGFLSFFVVDEAAAALRLAGATDNEYYKMSIKGYPFKPSAFRLKLSDTGNSIVKAVLNGRPESTADWDTVKRPRASGEATRLNQANSGIAYTMIYPLTGKIRGALMFNFYQYSEDMGPQQRAFMQRYTRLVSQALDGR